MNLDRTAPETADSGRLPGIENGISRRDTLALAAAGVTAAVLPTNSFAQTRQETNLMSTIKVGQENSQPIDLYYEDHGSGQEREICRAQGSISRPDLDTRG
jgi:hypothetical protein